MAPTASSLTRTTFHDVQRRVVNSACWQTKDSDDEISNLFAR